MRKVTMIAVAAAMLTTSCSSSTDNDDDQAKTQVVVDPVSGDPLSKYEGQPSYTWRKQLVETKESYLEQLATIDPALGDDSVLGDALNLCLDIDQGKNPMQVLRSTAARFGVDASNGGAKVVSLTVQYVCP